ncbi:MAG: hypothetical protein M1819_005235 [Sarea resinae]|nr:MAG: hypothetical protein M1819_005235 [Sarea resinae]
MASVTRTRNGSTQSSREAKLDEVTSLLETLRVDLSEQTLQPAERKKRLEQVKIYGRKVENAGPIFTKEEDNSDDEFLISRILFLLTYDTDLNFETLIDDCQLAQSINQNIARHSKVYSKKSSRNTKPSAHDDMALSETLKLVFNITHFYPDRSGDFDPSIPEILRILCRHRVPNPPLHQPINYLINAVMNLDLEDQKSPMFPKMDQKTNVEHLINILDASVRTYSETELDQLAAPLITLLRRIFEFGPDSVKRYMQWLLLPSDEERDKPMGRSDTLASRLLRLSTSAMAPNVRESISSLMFEMSGKDASQFVHNVGYGFASGFLMTHNLPIPAHAEQAWSTATATDSDGREVPINPITGQRRDREPVDAGPEMTEEEKEREAERLMVLFERLKRTGVMNVRNPVEQAVEEGRFEELD